MLLKSLILPLALVATAELHAHFLFIHVLDEQPPRAELHFAESAWDFSASPRMVDLISGTRFWIPGGGSAELRREPFAMVAELPDGSRAACGSYTYGLMTRGDAFLLEYHAKGVQGMDSAGIPAGLGAEIIAEPFEHERLKLTVLADGRPVPDAEIVVPLRGTETATMSTGEDGSVVIPLPATPLFSVRAMVPERREGTHEGQPYDLVRHYTTLTVHRERNVPPGSNGLARALLLDARGCNAGFVPDDVTWTGLVSGRAGPGRFEGTIEGDHSLTSTGSESSFSPEQAGFIRLVHGLPIPGSIDGMTVRFEVDRQAEAGTRVELPDDGIVYVVKDRRIDSVIAEGPRGGRRYDVVDWVDTDDGRMLPGRFLLTEFDGNGGIRTVTLVEHEHAGGTGLHIPSRQTATVVSGRSEPVGMSMDITGVETTRR